MTDITDQDRRDAREWAEKIDPTYRGNSRPLLTAARVILATVDAPAPTLAEEWRDMLEKQDAGEVVSFSGLLARTVQMERELDDTRTDRDHWKTDATQNVRELAESRAEVKRERDLGVAVAHERDESRAKVEQLEAARDTHERMYRESRAEVERLTAERDQARSELAEVTNARDSLREEFDHARTEVERLTAERLDRNPETKARVEAALNNLDQVEKVAVQKGAESNAETPDPADVKPGEAWVVEADGERFTALKGDDGLVPWNIIGLSGWLTSKDDESVTLITRLVPAPRVITNPDELDQAKRDTVIRDAAGVVCSRDGMGDAWTTFTSLANQRPHIALPVTVLWEPGEWSNTSITL